MIILSRVHTFKFTEKVISLYAKVYPDVKVICIWNSVVSKQFFIAIAMTKWKIFNLNLITLKNSKDIFDVMSVAPF